VAEEYGLRSDIGKNRGVTTVIASSKEMDDFDRDVERGVAGKGAWNNSETKLTEESSTEEDSQTWRNGGGIRKTTVSTQIAE
jgi:hypothetical protein